MHLIGILSVTEAPVTIHLTVDLLLAFDLTVFLRLLLDLQLFTRLVQHVLQALVRARPLNPPC